MGASDIAALLADGRDPAELTYWCERVKGAQQLIENRDGRP